jgi:hypothetical protein
VDVRSNGIERWKEPGERENVSAKRRSEALTPQEYAVEYRCITSPVLFF